MHNTTIMGVELLFLQLIFLFANTLSSLDYVHADAPRINHEHDINHFHDKERIKLVHHDHHNTEDPSLVVFFFLEDLKLENTIPIHFRRQDRSANLLAKDEADSIPFSSHQLRSLLRRFSFPRDSPQAVAMGDTLRACEAEPIEGETKTCPTSLESMLDFVKAIFGPDLKLRTLSTSFRYAETNRSLLQKYTVKGVGEVSAKKLVACHSMPYPYAVFYCHYQASKSRVFTVWLIGENGDVVEALAVCHLDTSRWSRNHMSFKILGVEPGSSPVCHFFPEDNFVWVPSE